MAKIIAVKNGYPHSVPPLSDELARLSSFPRVTWLHERQTAEAVLRKGILHGDGADMSVGRAHALFDLVLPKDYDERTPVMLHFVDTGDGHFSRMCFYRSSALVRQGLGVLFLENPGLRLRRPNPHSGFDTQFFSQVWQKAMATVTEAELLIEYLARLGFEKFGASGIGMGGCMTAVLAANLSRPIAAVPYIAAHAAEAVLHGMRFKSHPWLIDDALMEDPSLLEVLDRIDIRKFPVPRKPSAAIILSGRYEPYVPTFAPRLIHEHWSGSEWRELDTDHAGPFLFYSRDFQRTVLDALERLEKDGRERSVCESMFGESAL